MAWVNSSHTLTPQALEGLEACAHELPQEGEVTPDEITAVFTAVNALFDQVEKGSLNPHLKRAILELMGEIKRLTDQYRGFGVQRHSETP